MKKKIISKATTSSRQKAAAKARLIATKARYSKNKIARELARIKKMSEEELAAAINQGHQQIDADIYTARRHASLALSGALKVGTYLLVLHDKFGKTNWGPWIRKHCPSLPISTAYRYKDLAKKFSHVRITEEIPNLRQAYIAVGILQESPAKGKKSPDLSNAPVYSATDLVARVKNMRAFYRTEFDGFDVSVLEEPIWRDLKDELSGLLDELRQFVEILESANVSVKEEK